MRTISQRELRNDNAEIIRGVEGGETYLVTRRGVPVARLVPIGAESGPLPDRPARTRPTYADWPRVRIADRTEDLLDALRGDR